MVFEIIVINVPTSVKLLAQREKLIKVISFFCRDQTVVLSLCEQSGLLGEFPLKIRTTVKPATTGEVRATVLLVTQMSLGLKSTFLQPTLWRWGWDSANPVFPLPAVRLHE